MMAFVELFAVRTLYPDWFYHIAGREMLKGQREGVEQNPPFLGMDSCKGISVGRLLSSNYSCLTHCPVVPNDVPQYPQQFRASVGSFATLLVTVLVGAATGKSPQRIATLCP